MGVTKGWGLVLLRVLLLGTLLFRFQAEAQGSAGQDCSGAVPPGDLTSDGTESADKTSRHVLKKYFDYLLQCLDSENNPVTWETLDAYYKREELKRRTANYNATHARVAPFCVTPAYRHPKILRFHPILEEVMSKEAWRLDEPAQPPMWDPRDPRNPVLRYGLQRLSLMRIFTSNTRVPYLRQWLNFKLIFETALEGLYIQAIAGPVGIPFGEFRINVNCQDFTRAGAVVNLNDFYEKPGIVPCYHKPASAARFPHVFVYGGEKAIVNKRKEFRVHFSWVDGLCAEAPMMQFLFIAVKKFPNDYLVFRSPVYEHLPFDSFDGAPFPLYIGWENKITCNKNEMDPKAQFVTPVLDSVGPEADSGASEISSDYRPLNEHIDNFDNSTLHHHGQETNLDNLYSAPSRKMTNLVRNRRQATFDCTDRNTCLQMQFKAYTNRRIFYSKEYDDCILRDTGYNAVTKSCPPGPFVCRKGFTDRNKGERDRIRQGAFTITDKCKHCTWPKKSEFPAANDPVSRRRRAAEGADETIDAQTPPGPEKPPEARYQLINATYELGLAVEAAFREDKRLHGWFMVLVFLIVVPAISFLSRFFKDTAKPDGNGFFACCGMPQWLTDHVIASYIGTVLIWYALGMVSGYPSTGVIDCNEFDKEPKTPPDEEDFETCKKYSSKTTGHVFLGLIAVIAYHKQLIDGWIRPSGLFKRNCIMALHSVGGYFTHLCAVISAVIAGVCPETLSLVIVLLVMSLILFGVGTALQFVQDRRLGIRRKCFPVLQGVEPQKSPPLGTIKSIVNIAYVAIHFLILFAILLSYLTMHANDKGSWNETEYSFMGLLSCKARGNQYFRARILCKEYLLDEETDGPLNCNDLVRPETLATTTTDY